MKRSPQDDQLNTLIDKYVDQFKQHLPTKEEQLELVVNDLANACRTLSNDMCNNLSTILQKKGLVDHIYQLLLNDNIKLSLHAELYMLLHSMYVESNKTLDNQEKLLTAIINEMIQLSETKEDMKQDVHLLIAVVTVLIDFIEFSQEYSANISTSPLLVQLIHMLNPTKQPYTIPIHVAKLLVVLTDDNQLCTELLTQKVPDYYDTLTNLCKSTLPSALRICYATILHNIHPVINKTIPYIFPIITKVLDVNVIDQLMKTFQEKETNPMTDLFVDDAEDVQQLLLDASAMKTALELITNITTFEVEPHPLIKKSIEESKIPTNLIDIIQHPIPKTNNIIVNLIETSFSALNNVLLMIDSNYTVTFNNKDSNFMDILEPILVNIVNNCSESTDPIDHITLDGSMMCYHRILLKSNKTIEEVPQVFWELIRKVQTYDVNTLDEEIHIIITLCYILSVHGKTKQAPLEDIAKFVINVLELPLTESTEQLYDAVLNVIVDIFPEKECNDVIISTGLFAVVKKNYKEYITYTLSHLTEDDTSLEEVINNLERFIKYKTDQGL
ncbi:Uncharacterized protein QTN25_009338 [Entamoeba marina]